MAFELDTIMQVGVVKVANLEKLKEDLSLALEEFKSIPLTMENVPKLKEARARLNKAAESFNKRRIELGRTFYKPFQNFQEEVESVITMIRSVSGPIDFKINEFEDEENSKKTLQIKAMFGQVFKKNYLEVEQIWQDKWTNKTYSLDQIQKDILASIEKIESDLKVIDRLSYGYDDKIQIKLNYIDSPPSRRNLETSIKWFEEQQELIKKYFGEVVEEAEVVFKVVGNYEELVKLSKFLKENNYNYKKIK